MPLQRPDEKTDGREPALERQTRFGGGKRCVDRRFIESVDQPQAETRGQDLAPKPLVGASPKRPPMASPSESDVVISRRAMSRKLRVSAVSEGASVEDLPS